MTSFFFSHIQKFSAFLWISYCCINVFMWKKSSGKKEYKSLKFVNLSLAMKKILIKHQKYNVWFFCLDFVYALKYVWIHFTVKMTIPHFVYSTYLFSIQENIYDRNIFSNLISKTLYVRRSLCLENNILITTFVVSDKNEFFCIKWRGHLFMSTGCKYQYILKQDLEGRIMFRT